VIAITKQRFAPSRPISTRPNPPWTVYRSRRCVGPTESATSSGRRALTLMREPRHCLVGALVFGPIVSPSSASRSTSVRPIPCAQRTVAITPDDRPDDVVLRVPELHLGVDAIRTECRIESREKHASRRSACKGKADRRNHHCKRQFSRCSCPALSSSLVCCRDSPLTRSAIRS
jgi:hypothetical protein